MRILNVLIVPAQPGLKSFLCHTYSLARGRTKSPFRNSFVFMARSPICFTLAPTLLFAALGENSGLLRLVTSSPPSHSETPRSPLPLSLFSSQFLQPL